MFDSLFLSDEDFALAKRYTGDAHFLRDPDLTIAPSGEPYLYRWHLVPERSPANVYFHIQVADDPERPLHTHPWENTSVILAGGYTEYVQEQPPLGEVQVHQRHPGQVIHRSASLAHRLLLPDTVPYTMTLFTTGPKTHEWGFWQGDEFIHWTNVTELTPDGRSIWKDV